MKLISEPSLRALLSCCSILLLLNAVHVAAEDPYRFFDWNITYGDIYPLGVKQQVCICAVEARKLNSRVLSFFIFKLYRYSFDLFVF